ncbi:MAG: ribonuclease P protein component, partial [Ktedonobacterales bacterium]
QRLRSSRDFGRVRRRGRRISGPTLALSYARQSVEVRGITRVGFSVSKRVGDAVVRNRVKRRLREIVRRCLPRVVPGWDLILTPTTAAAQADYVALAGEIDELLTRAGLWNADQIYELYTSRGPGSLTDQNTVPDAPADTQQESSSKSI